MIVDGECEFSVVVDGVNEDETSVIWLGDVHSLVGGGKDESR